MELRQIEYFCMVAKLRNFTRAAEQLHVAQPSVTYAIHKLEEELSIQLFDRSKKKATLSKEGELILTRMEKILLDLQQTVQEANDLKNLRKGTVKVGVPPMIEAGLFPTIFPQFKAAYPDLQLIASEEISSLQATSKLEADVFDLAIMILPDKSETLNTLVITQEEFALCLPPNHPLCQQQSVQFHQLRNEPFILLKEGSYQHQIVTSRCLRQHFIPNIVFSSSQVQTIKNLVANGSGISFLMNMVIRNDPKITVVPLDEPITFNIGLAWRKDKYLSNASMAFVNLLKQLYHLSGEAEDGQR